MKTPAAVSAAQVVLIVVLVFAIDCKGVFSLVREMGGPMCGIELVSLENDKIRASL